MRKSLILVAAAGLLAFTACTVKNTTAPALAGPSTFAKDIVLTASPDSILQDGASQSVITVVAKDAAGQASEVTLRAEILVGGVAMDFGSLSSKTRVTSGGSTTFVYTAPNAPTTSATAAQVVTIAISPIGGDFGTLPSRTVDIRLVPPGVIGPNNPNLVALFTVLPASPTAFSPAAFDASTSTNLGVACLNACAYAWDFGDGSTGAGLKTSHEYRLSGVKTVKLTVSDSTGAQAISIQSITVNQSTPPTAVFVFSPTPAVVYQDVFFNADASRPAAGRRIVSYDWNFGDGTKGSGVTTSKYYPTAATYSVTLTVTDDAGAIATVSQSVAVNVTGTGLVPNLVVSPIPVTTASPAFFDASGTTGPSPIAAYIFNYGDGSPDDGGGTAPRQQHQFTATGTYLVRLTVRDVTGRVATTTLSVAVTNPGPVPLFTFAPASPATFALVSFNASGTTGPSPIATYAWDFGDGASGSGQLTTHTYTTSGPKAVTLTVTDTLGRTASSTQTVTVQ